MKYLRKILPVIFAMLLLVGCNAYNDGVEYLDGGEYAKAEEAFAQAISEDKNLKDSYRGLGIALWEQEKYGECAQALKQALEHGGEKSGTIYAMIANCGMELENYPEAVQFYVLGLEAEGVSSELKQEMEFNLIAAYEKQGEFELAKEKLAEYVVKYPEDERAAKEALFLETR